jgi:hypothetical protein
MDVMRQRDQTMARLSAVFVALALACAPGSDAQAAAYPCQPEMTLLHKWNTEFIKKLRAQRLKPVPYTAVYTPYNKRRNETYGVLAKIKDPKDCAAVSQDWCAELMRDYPQYAACQS